MRLDRTAADRRTVLKGAAMLASAAAATRGAGAVPAPTGNALSRYNMVHDNPGEPPFVTKYRHPGWLKADGYDGVVARLFLPCTVTYDAVDPTLMPPGSPARAKVDAYAGEVRAAIREAHAAGMPIYPFTDLLVLPKAVIERYGKELTPDGAAGSTHGTLGGAGLLASTLAPRTEQLLRAQIAEIFARFPDLDGITTRFGETYLFEWPEYAGSSPARSPEEQRRLIEILRDEVCVKRDRTLIYRTWDFGRFHTQPALYLAATDAVPPHPKLFFSIKHVGADFLRLQPFNQTLGIGRHQQIVEVSSSQAGVYGKNAHPYYFTGAVIDGWPRYPWIAEPGRFRSLRDFAASPLLKGVWTWSRGDGWRGPYIDNEMWVDLAEEVMAGFCRDPRRPEPALFAAAARRVTGVTDRDLPLFRELCLLSTGATLAGQDSVHMTPFEWGGGEEKIDPATGKPIMLTGSYRQQWWCRDDGISAIDLAPVVKAGKTQAVLAEKAGATRDWRRIEALSRRIRLPDPAKQSFLEVSCSYGRIKYALFEQIWIMQLLAAEAAAGKTTVSRDPMRAAIAAYDRLWDEWERLKAGHRDCPSLYSDTQVKYVDAPPFRQVLDDYRKLAA